MSANGHRRRYPYVLDPDELSPLDLDRAKVALGHVLEGRSPYAVIGEDGELTVKLTMWALATRDDPDLTWEQAIALPFNSFTPPRKDDDEPPPGSAASPSSSGSPSDAPSATPNGTSSRPRRRSAATTASNPASSTGSPSAS